MKKIFFIFLGFFIVVSAFSETLLFWNFSQEEIQRQSFKDWLEKENLEPQKGFGKFPFEAQFRNNRLYITSKKNNFGFYGRETKIEGATKLRITWGIEKFYTKGDNWLAGIQRIPIHLTLSFGEKKISSGSPFVPNVPYFISFILTKNIDNTKLYTAKFYKKGGRYYCSSCPIQEGERVVTEIDLLPVLEKAYGMKNVPVISLVSFGLDNRGTSLDAISFIEKIEIF